MQVSANVVAIEDLKVVDTPLALENLVPNGWFHWGGMVALVGGKFSGGDPKGPAVLNNYGLYARDVTSKDFGQVLISNTERGQVQGGRLDEYVSFPGQRLFEDTPEKSIGLPIQREPEVAWENDSTKWLCADDLGATANDGKDDSEAIQKAMDAAAAKGATVVYFRGCGGGDPNWFNLERTIRVPAPVRMVMGLGWARLLGGKEGGFVVDDASSPRVKFQNIDSFGGTPITLTNASAKNALLVESCGVRVVGNGAGDIFLTDVPGTLDLQKPGQKCWARQFNPEGESDDGLVKNNGGDLWCLGVKHEGKGVRFTTRHGGRTEVLGLFDYQGSDENDARPLFEIDNASFSVAALREIAFSGITALNKVRENRAGEIRLFDKNREGAGGWIGWSLFSGFKK